MLGGEENLERGYDKGRRQRYYTLYFAVSLFASTFVEKVRRGFRSFARREGAEGNEYVLVAELANPVDNIEGLPQLEALECEIKNEGSTIIF